MSAKSHATKRICLATSSFPRWAGDPTAPYLLQLARDMMARGWQVDVLAPHAVGLQTYEILSGVPVTRFRYAWPGSRQTLCYGGGALVNLRRQPADWLKVPALAICQWLALRRLVRNGPCHVVHAHWVLPQGLVAIAAGGGVPVVISVHGSDVFGLRGRLWTWLKRLALCGAAAVTVNSSATEAAVRAIAPNVPVLKRIPMGVAVAEPAPARARQDTRRELRLDDGPVLLFVGRLVAQKGVADLLQAMAILAGDESAASAVIVGDGPERPRLEAQAAALRIDRRVRFVGLVDPARVPEYLAAADIFVAPSKAISEGGAEGQGLAVIEAMLAGVPVIASRSGGLVDAVRSEETGLLVDEGDPAQIAAAAARLLRDRDLAQRLARQARAMAVDTYAAERTADSFSRLFADLSAPGLSRAPHQGDP